MEVLEFMTNKKSLIFSISFSVLSYPFAYLISYILFTLGILELEEHGFMILSYVLILNVISILLYINNYLKHKEK